MPQFDDRNAMLGATACWTASVRALETRRHGRLFADPWAEDLAGQVGADWRAQRTEDSVISIVLRTRFFDDFLQRIITQYHLDQIVLLAAGLDTRAYRLVWPAHIHLFELDQADVLNRKKMILERAGADTTCERRALGVDLTAEWKSDLLRAGFAPARPSGWLLEGLCFYLPNDTVTQLLDNVTALAATGSWLGFDVINSLVLESPWTKAWVEMQAQAGAPWIGTMDNPGAFLHARGWQATITQAGQPDANHGRWHYPVFPVDMPNMPHNWLVTAQRT